MKGDNDSVNSSSDERTINNVMRHEYRVLTQQEKDQMATLKDMGRDLWQFLDSMGNSRELSLAKTHVEDAVMRGVRHITE
ncbi:MAG: hypothetical protein WD750_05795 [Gammaproteobacteria bacterium]